MASAEKQPRDQHDQASLEAPVDPINRREFEGLGAVAVGGLVLKSVLRPFEGKISPTTTPVEFINKIHPVMTDVWAEVDDEGKEIGTYVYAFTTSNNNRIAKSEDCPFVQWTFKGLSTPEVGLLKLLFHKDNNLAVTAASLPFVKAAADFLANQPGLGQISTLLQNALAEASKHINEIGIGLSGTALTRRNFLKWAGGSGAVLGLAAVSYGAIRHFLDEGGMENVFNALPPGLKNIIHAAMAVENSGGTAAGGAPTDNPEPTTIATPTGTATATPFTIYLPFIVHDFSGGAESPTSTATSTAVHIESTSTAEPSPTAEATSTLTITPSKTPEPTRTPEKPKVQEASNLHEILNKRGLLLGVDLNPQANNLDGEQKQIVNNFNQVALGVFPMAWMYRNGEDITKIDSSAPDQWVKWATRNRMSVINGNPLIYHHEIPDWLKTGNFSKEQLTQIMQNYIKAVVERYKGRVSQWIVLNEAYTYYQGTTGIQDYVFPNIIGPDYVDLAYQAAREADPKATLIYNDWGIELPGPKADFIFEQVKRLKENGLVDAVGMQFHIGTPSIDIGSPVLNVANPPSKEDIISQIKRYTDIGVEVIVTELDVDVRPIPGNREEKAAKQAEIYKTIVEACFEGGCKNITVWGLNDDDSYLGTEASAVLFSQGKPKPAFQAIKDTVTKVKENGV